MWGQSRGNLGIASLFFLALACSGGSDDPLTSGAPIGSQLEILIGDNFQTRTHQEHYYLRSPSGIRTVVSPSDLPLIRTIDGSSDAGLLTTPAKTPKVHIGAILVNFRNDRSQPWSRADIENDLFYGAQSLAAYYHEVSFGQLKVKGDVLGWYQLPFDRPAGCDDMNGLLEQVISALPQVKFEHYSNILIGIPRICNDWDGFGTVGGIALPGQNQLKKSSMTSIAWINGGQAFGPVAIHEMGHNLGVHHANACEGVPKANGCTSLEYEDPFDIMGFVHLYEKPRQMNAYHKEALGWFQKENVTIATQSGTYALAPIEASTNAPQLIKIPRNGNSWYYLEYRQPIGFDSELSSSSPASRGVSIRYAPMYLSGGDSHLIDTTSGGLSHGIFDDAPLVVGNTYYDSLAKIQITTTRASSTGLSVAIEMTPSDPILAPLPPPPPDAGNIFCTMLDPNCR